MKLIMLPLLLSLAYIGFEHKDQIMDQYNAAYPTNPEKAAAIAQCALNPSFNRLDSDDRHDCYAAHLVHGPVAIAPSPSPYYAFSTSHLPGSDIRRQEANADYQYAVAMHSTQAIPTVVALHARAPLPVAVVHRVVATHTTRNCAKAVALISPAPRA
jgi:hypothetical protein